MGGRSQDDPEAPLPLRSATALLGLLKARKIGAVELLDACFAQVERLNPKVNAIVALDVESARRRAREADEAAARGRSLGPLHGLPITIKDSFEVAGMPTTCGFEELRDHRPAHDALAVAKLRAAGANIFGKTNLPPGATDHQTYNALFGITRNPWNLDRTVGGSSGGSAAAVATGMSALELGSDIGGSIRVPAHFCGVCGHKSSYGLVTSRGQIPPMPGEFLLSEMSVAGPLARSPEDLELALDNLNGPDELEAGRVVVTLPPARHKELREFRVGLWADGADFTLDGGYRGTIEGFADDLRRLGVTVDEHARPAFDPRRCYEDYLGCLFGIIGAAVPEAVLENFDHAGVGAKPGSYGDILPRAVRQSLREWKRISEAREVLYRVWRQFFTAYDVLICPVAPRVAFPHDTSGIDITAQFSRTLTVDGRPVPYFDNLQWPGIVTVANLPATAVPTGRLVDGLPAGIQLIGPYLEDRTPLRFAQLVAAQLGCFRPPPVADGR